MAVDTSVTALTGNGVALGMKEKVLQREVDFSVTNLAAGDWFQLFDLSVGHIVNWAVIEIVTAGTASATVSLGVDAGTEVVTEVAADATAGTRYMSTNTVPIDFSGNTLDISGLTAALVLGVVRVTVGVADTSDYTG